MTTPTPTRPRTPDQHESPAPPRDKDTLPVAVRRGLEALGYDDLRPGQAEVIADVCAGRHVVALMPTGSGKSLCYQLPAWLFHQHGETTLVISPLIALMRDQVEGLTRRGIATASLTSADTASERAATLTAFERGELAMLYIAPERLRSARFLEACKNLHGRIGLLAIDEAHCISEWGHDFRPEYRRLGELALELAPKRIAAFTATATPEVRDDIARQLRLESPAIHVHGFDRPNLHLAVRTLAAAKDKPQALLELTRQRSGGVAVVYASTRKRAEEYRDLLAAKGMRVGVYHAGLDDAMRHRAQDAFMAGAVDVLVATNAFGMGVDKRDVRLVVHADLPRSLEAYYQEAGRAGRDGKGANAVLLYGRADVRLQQFLIDSSCPSPEVLRALWKAVRAAPIHAGAVSRLAAYLPDKTHDMTIDAAIRILERHGLLQLQDDTWHATRPEPDAFAPLDPEQYLRRARVEHQKLAAMVEYAEAHRCRRQTILSYFGDPQWLSRAHSCGYCDVCEALAKRLAHGTAAPSPVAALLLRAIIALGGRFGRKRALAFARGLDDDARLTQLDEFGSLARAKAKDVQHALRWLEQEGFVESSGGEYPTIACSATGRAWLETQARVVTVPAARRRTATRR